MTDKPPVRLTMPELTVFLEDGLPEVEVQINPDYLTLKLLDLDGHHLLELALFLDSSTLNGAERLADRLTAAIEKERRLRRYRPLVPSSPNRPARRRPRRPRPGGAR